MRYGNCLVCKKKFDERDLKLRICPHCRDSASQGKEPHSSILMELNIHPFDLLNFNKTRPKKNISPRMNGINLRSIRQRLKKHQLGKV